MDQPVFSKDLGHRVLVANPRKVRAIYKAERKSDDRGAELPARLARVDDEPLHPVEHGDEKQQRDMLLAQIDRLTAANDDGPAAGCSSMSSPTDHRRGPGSLKGAVNLSLAGKVLLESISLHEIQGHDG